MEVPPLPPTSPSPSFRPTSPDGAIGISTTRRSLPLSTLTVLYVSALGCQATRQVARELAAEGVIEITQKGQVRRSCCNRQMRYRHCHFDNLAVPVVAEQLFDTLFV